MPNININKSCMVNVLGTKLVNYQSNPKQTAASLLKAFIDTDMKLDIPDADRAKFAYSSNSTIGLLFVQTPWCRLTLKLFKV
jgi:hypothetical protein